MKVLKIILSIFGAFLLLPVVFLIGYKIYTRPPATPHGINAKCGRKQARVDLARRKIRFMEAGTNATFTPGVPSDSPTYAKIPRWKLPSGCTTPDASAWIDYAAGYNDFILDHLHDRR